jgi:putative sterol carrier protein
MQDRRYHLLIVLIPERRKDMTFDELVTKVRNMAQKVDASNKDFLAVQINIEGKDSGVFYVECKDHRINVEPYDYHDRNCAITMNMTNFNKLIDGKLDPVLGYTTGKIKVDGDLGKALEFSKLLK